MMAFQLTWTRKAEEGLASEFKRVVAAANAETKEGEDYMRENLETWLSNTLAKQYESFQLYAVGSSGTRFSAGARITDMDYLIIDQASIPHSPLNSLTLIQFLHNKLSSASDRVITAVESLERPRRSVRISLALLGVAVWGAVTAVLASTPHHHSPERCDPRVGDSYDLLVCLCYL